MSKPNRLQVLINLLESRPGIKAPELAEETGVCERTIYRDLLWLESQYPINHNHGYSLPPPSNPRPITITKAEYNVLRLALSSPVLQRQDLRQITCGLKAKIDLAVDPNVWNCSSRINVYAPVLTGHCSEMQRLATFCGILPQAIAKCRAVDLDFIDDLKECSRIYPYHLVYCHSDWVLVGYCRSKREFEALKLSSLEEISLTNNSFERDASFSLEEFFLSRWRLKGGSEATVKVRFTDSAANIILSRKHHPKEEVMDVGDGSVLYTLTIRGVEEMIPWILSFGPEAEVLEPKSLREQVEERVRCLARVYNRNCLSAKKTTGTRLYK